MKTMRLSLCFYIIGIFRFIRCCYCDN